MFWDILTRGGRTATVVMSQKMHWRYQVRCLREVLVVVGVGDDEAILTVSLGRSRLQVRGRLNVYTIS